MIHSILSVPAHDLEKLNSANQYPADALMIDLEDGVPINNKKIALTHALDFLKSKQQCPIFLRINAINTPQGLEDLYMLLQHKLYIDYLMIPKCNSGEMLAIIKSCLQDEYPQLILCPIFETAQAMLNIESILNELSSTSFVFYGRADLSADLGYSVLLSNQHFLKHFLLLSCQNLHITCVDSPCLTIANEDLLIEELQEAKSIGMTTKVALHPVQLTLINETLSDSPAMYAKAKKTLALHKAYPEKFMHEDILLASPFIKMAKNLIKS